MAHYYTLLFSKSPKMYTSEIKDIVQKDILFKRQLFNFSFDNIFEIFSMDVKTDDKNIFSECKFFIDTIMEKKEITSVT